MDVSSSQVYANFRAWVPRNLIPVGALNPQEWLYYDWGPRSYPEPVVCLHGLVGSAESFFLQVTSLAPRGYRVISVQIAEYWTVQDFCDALQSFLDMLNISRVHFYGVDIGGFLAMNYLARHPERVASIVLTHSYLSTENLQLNMRCSAGVLRWLPDFLVRGAVRDTFPKGRFELPIASAAEFVIRNTMTATRGQLASRLALAISKSSVVGRHRLPEHRITLIDSIERSRERDVEVAFETARFLPGAKRALLKGGGDFPYISEADEVNMHLIVHLRRNAVAPTQAQEIPPPALLPKVWRHDRTEAGSPVSPTRSENVVKDQEEVDVNGEENDIDNEEEEEAEKAPLLNEFLPESQDGFLSTVMSQSDGDLNVSVSKVLEADCATSGDPLTSR